MPFASEVNLHTDLTREDIAGNVVAVRSDLNLPKSGDTYETGRLRAEGPCLRDILGKDGRLVVISHMGRYGDGESLEPVRPLLAAELGIGVDDVLFPGDCIGDAVSDAIRSMRPGQAVLLENTRIYQEDEAYADDPSTPPVHQFVELLASSKKYLVFNGFGVAHRENASTTGIIGGLPSYAGPLLLEEIGRLEPFKGGEPEKSVAAAGGKKLAEKMLVFGFPYGSIIPGGLALNCVLKRNGYPVGSSPTSEKDKDYTDMAPYLSRRAGILIPQRLMIARPIRENKKVVGYEGAGMIDLGATIPEGYMIVDFELTPEMEDKLGEAERILLVGPLGIYEAAEKYGFGNIATDAVVGYMRNAPLRLAMGGDTEAATKSGIPSCTGGGAAVEFIRYGDLPVLAALRHNKKYGFETPDPL
jgi:phosphoglycerate kinase